MTRVKICGITRAEDALLASALGAWAVGFVFYPGSPRYIAPVDAASVIAGLPAGVIPVGVFVNEAPEAILEVAARSGIRAAQLHGDEDARAVDALQGKLETIQARRLSSPQDVAALSLLRPSIGILIDAAIAGRYGGTGELANWELARAASRHGRILLSGGLSPGNVRQAIIEVSPFAVDASSGLEERPGVKSPAKLREFFKQIKESERPHA